MDRRDWQVGFDQFVVLDLIGMLFLPRRPSDLRVHDKCRAFAGRIKHEWIRRMSGFLRIEHIAAIAHFHLRLEMGRFEMIVPYFDHLPEGHVRTPLVGREEEIAMLMRRWDRPVRYWSSETRRLACLWA
jgi:hypothetical protein